MLDLNKLIKEAKQYQNQLLDLRRKSIYEIINNDTEKKTFNGLHPIY